MASHRYAICRHTCTTCISTLTQTILWPMQHGSATRHAVDPGPHPDCNEDCEGHKFLNTQRSRNSNAIRNPTSEELEEHLPTPIGEGSQVTTFGSHPFRVLEMLYITDPVQAESNKHRATGDLGFMSATVTLEEWNLVKHLTSYVHGPNQISTAQKAVKVLIHEWVSHKNTRTCLFNELNISQVYLILSVSRYKDTNQPGKGFNIEFMNWGEYKDILITGPGGPQWRELYAYDCIIGGIDLDMGYL